MLSSPQVPQYYSLQVDNDTSSYASLYRRLAELPVNDHTVFIEDAYLGRNPKSLIVAVTARAKLQVIFELAGWRVVMVKPSSWQSPILKQGWGAHRPELKGAAKWLTKLLTGESPKSDMCDSFCICIYGRGRNS
jgi:Holliday junction resolvasome RuvABC endonuclease subunit